MLKSVEETTLLTKLEELVQLAKKKKNVLEYKEIMDHLADFPSIGYAGIRNTKGLMTG